MINPRSPFPQPLDAMAQQIKGMFNPNGGTAANQARFGGGEQGAEEEGLSGYLNGAKVAPEWAASSAGKAAIAKYKLTVHS